jgi:zinc and cadmium transporter
MEPQTWAFSLAAVALVSLISLIGAAIGMRWLSRHAVVLTLVAVAAGALLGDSIIHLLPEATELWDGFGVPMATLVIAGFVLFFLLETVLRHSHAHGEHGLDNPHAHNGAHAGHAHGHDAAHGAGRRVAVFGWTNLAGDALHNFIDGVIIAAAFAHDAWLGVATTVAVALHEIPQELGDFAVLVKAGIAPRKALLYNLASAVTAFAGAVLFLLLAFETEALERYALPITAGGFLYIAAADLIPELHHHTGDRHSGLILAGFLGGLGLMFALLGLE